MKPPLERHLRYFSPPALLIAFSLNIVGKNYHGSIPSFPATCGCAMYIAIKK